MTIIESFDQVIEFVAQNTDIPASIDLSIRWGDPLSFWAGISLDRGEIKVNPRLADLGNFIHDLGHVATCPPELRQFATGKMGADFRREIERFVGGASLKENRHNSDTSSRRFGADEDIDDDAATYWAVLLSKLARRLRRSSLDYQREQYSIKDLGRMPISYINLA
jgi:hypothetical protein